MKPFFVIITLALLMACSESGTRMKPLSTGRLGELFVVIDKDLMNDRVQSAFRSSLAASQLLYGGEEPYFEVFFLTPDLVKSTLVYEGTLILVTRSGSQSEVARIMPDGSDSFIVAKKRSGVTLLARKDLWSIPQSLLFMISDHPDSIANFVYENAAALRSKVLEMELAEAVGKAAHVPNELIGKEIGEKHGIDINVPNSYHVVLNKKLTEQEGFVWLRSEGAEIDLNVVIHYEPYRDTAQLELSYIIARRDSIVKPFITGEAKGSYMATDNQFPYFLETVDFKGHYARAYNGYWTMQNDFMGGPYYSITVVDEAKQRLITLEGFVYAPNKEKTRYLRELQGILYGAEF